MKFLTKQVLKEYEAVKILAEADKFSGKTLTKEAYEDIKETKKRLFVAGEKRYFSRKKNGQDFDEAYHEKLFENVLDEREKTLAVLPDEVKEKIDLKHAALGEMEENGLLLARRYVASSLPRIENITDRLRESNEEQLKKLCSFFDAEMIFEEIVYGITRAGDNLTIIFKDAALSLFSVRASEDELPAEVLRFDEADQYSPVFVLKAAEFYALTGGVETHFLSEQTDERGISELFYFTAVAKSFTYREL